MLILIPHQPVQPKSFKHRSVSDYFGRQVIRRFSCFYLATYINITEQPARYRGWRLYFPDTGLNEILFDMENIV